MCTLIFTVDLTQAGATALLAACLESHHQVVELLLQAGASVNQKTEVRWQIGDEYRNYSNRTVDPI